MSSSIPQSCAVRERTADGVSVGRCFHHSPGGICPRHGDVSAVQRRFAETGKLTDERDLPSRAHQKEGE